MELTSVLIDTNIMLDVLLKRQPFLEEAKLLELLKMYDYDKR